MAEEKLLVVDGLKMHFHTRDGVVKAVDGVSYELKSGETLGVVGESGSGKSVTALTMMRLIPMPPGRVVGGDVLFRGQSLLKMSDDEIRKIRGNRIAMVFQDPMTSLNPVYRVGRQIAEPLMLHKNMSKKEAWARAVELLDLVGIPHPESRVKDYPHQFSGGMRQRVMIAMALACDPDILIADEPTTALDVTIQAQILELMEELQDRTGSAIILITHDLGVVADMADNVLVMYAGRPVEYGSVDELFYRPLHPYTWGLMDSLPEYAVDEKGTLCPIKGQPPSLINVPQGCAFHPRCPFARDICFTDTPQFLNIEGTHGAACHFAGESGFTRSDACPVPLSGDEEVA
jgi:oligopeptide transport system ATP-binding protein